MCNFYKITEQNFTLSWLVIAKMIFTKVSLIITD